MRYWLYNLIMWLLLPLWILYSWRRCKNQTLPSKCWRQLWCFLLPDLPPNGIWIHAVSLGEAQVAISLIESIRQKNPSLPIFFTGGNKSAVALAERRMLPKMAVSFLPLDYIWLRRKLFNHLKPRLLMLIETELWPNLIMQAHKHHIAVAVIQARLSKSSQHYYPRYGQPLLSQILSPIVFLAAQTQADRAFFIGLGAKNENCHCLGNLKYDIKLPENISSQRLTLSQRIGHRWTWVAGSTHPTEEIDILHAHIHLLEKHPDALLIIAPRHMSHLDDVIQRLSDLKLDFQKWTSWRMLEKHLPGSTQVILIDTLGVLMLAYACADACFVGGSLVPWGGHNLLEPAALGKPIIAGPHNHNFAEIEHDLLSNGGMVIVNNAIELTTLLSTWLENPGQATTIGQHAQDRFLAQQGSMNLHLKALSPWLSKYETSPS